MQPDTGFNAIAATYDAGFTQSITGSLQRKRVWHYLKKYLRSPLSVLEINCGTGEDAIMLAGKGHQVTATDLSEEMIRVAAQKNNPGNVTFSVCGFEELHLTYPDEQYQLIFSNFAGLNCVDAATLKKLNSDFSKLLAPKGKLIMVLLGKKCWIERLFFTWKGEPGKAKRRQQQTTAKLNDHATQQTFCYDAKEIALLFADFKMTEKKPVGIFIPPSYLEPLIKRNRFMVPFIQIAECLGSFSWLSDHADHTFMVLEKK
ncbi:MAG: methyltransferase domain-containing protein [Bacteroidota bacterium]